MSSHSIQGPSVVTVLQVPPSCNENLNAPETPPHKTTSRPPVASQSQTQHPSGSIVKVPEPSLHDAATNNTFRQMMGKIPRLPKKPKFRNPELSIARFCGSTGKYQCWEAQGPAREIFKELSPKLKIILDEKCDPVLSSSMVIYEVYMVGKHSAIAIPQIMFSCQKLGPRKDAVMVVKRSKILDNYQGVQLGHWQFPPNILNPQLYGLEPRGTIKILLVPVYQKDKPFVELERAAKSMIAMRVLTTTSRGSIADAVDIVATVGSVICYAGREYFLSVAHFIAAESENAPQSTGSSDDDDDDDEDSTFEFGGLTDDDQSSSEDTIFSGNDLSSDSETGDDLYALPKTTELLSQSPEPQIIDGKKPKFEPSLRQTMNTLQLSNGIGAKVFLHSTELDYAVLETTEETNASSGLPTISTTSTKEIPSQNERINVITSSSGRLTGILSGNPSYIRFPFSRAYRRVFVVTLDGILRPGDSGSIVIEPNSQTIYGHIVAGSPVSMIAYIISSRDVLQDLEIRLREIGADNGRNEVPQAEKAHNYDELVVPRDQDTDFASLRPSSEQQLWIKRWQNAYTELVAGAPATYAYKAIDYDREIRILRIYPGSLESRLECSLIPRPLLEEKGAASYESNCIDYTALSCYLERDSTRHRVYMFAGEDAHTEFKRLTPVTQNHLIQTKIVGYSYIQDNMNKALRAIRNNNDSVFVWCDALCIHQQNLEEKSAQVSRMQNIYGQAQETCIWLGEEVKEEKNRRTFGILRILASCKSLPYEEEDFSDITDLMENPWFKRRWAIQELAFSHKPYVRRGLEVMAWEDFSDALALFTSNYEKTQQPTLNYEKTKYPTSNYEKTQQPSISVTSPNSLRDLAANVLISATTELFRKSAKGGITELFFTLEQLVCIPLLGYKVTDPRDAIFAFLPIAKDIASPDLGSNPVFMSTKPHGGNSVTKDGQLNSFLEFCADFVLYASLISFLYFFRVVGSILNRFNLLFPVLKEFSTRPEIDAWEKSKYVKMLLDWLGEPVLLLLIYPAISMFGARFVRRVIKIFGVRPQYAVNPRLQPNYEKDVVDVYGDFLEYCFETSSSLDILCHNWGAGLYSQSSSLPSWISWMDKQHRDKGGLIGDLTGRRNYSASGNTRPEYRFGKNFVSSELKRKPRKQASGEYSVLQYSQNIPPRFDGKLIVKGIKLGEIKDTQRISGSTIPYEALDLLGLSRKTNVVQEIKELSQKIDELSPKKKLDSIIVEQEIQELSQKIDKLSQKKKLDSTTVEQEIQELSQKIDKLSQKKKLDSTTVAQEIRELSQKKRELVLAVDEVWRTLVANRGPKSANAPNWYRRAFMELYRTQELYRIQAEPGKLDVNSLKTLDGTPQALFEFLDRVEQVVWNKTCFKTFEENGRQLAGLAPGNARRGDVVCILFGCSVPVVLSPYGENFVFLGECYVAGMMDGQAVDPMSSKSSIQTFTLS